MGVPERMRRVVVSPGSIDVVDSPTPEPLPGEVLVHSVVSGVCGSDTHAAHGRHPFIELPYHPGHEVVGVVAARGEGVDSVEVGQRVTVEPDLPCWNCKQCRRGTREPVRGPAILRMRLRARRNGRLLHDSRKPRARRSRRPGLPGRCPHRTDVHPRARRAHRGRRPRQGRRDPRRGHYRAARAGCRPGTRRQADRDHRPAARQA